MERERSASPGKLRATALWVLGLVGGLSLGAEPSGPVDLAAYAKQHALEQAISLDLGNGLKVELALIPPGKFSMGSPETERERKADETQHEVTITQPFYMGKYEVTVNQFSRFVVAAGYKTEAEKEGFGFSWTGTKLEKVNGINWRSPGFQQGGDHPVCAVSWNDAKAFCEWLSKVANKTVQLPTEAQWEYAARAGTTTAYPWGDNPDDGKGWGNAADQTLKESLKWPKVFNWVDGYAYTAPVGQFRQNTLGLRDTLGNLWEWCQDWHGDYPQGAVTDPQGPASGQFRVLRGGSWGCDPRGCRSAFRFGGAQASRPNIGGFRVVATGVR